MSPWLIFRRASPSPERDSSRKTHMTRKYTENNIDRQRKNNYVCLITKISKWIISLSNANDKFSPYNCAEWVDRNSNHREYSFGQQILDHSHVCGARLVGCQLSLCELIAHYRSAAAFLWRPIGASRNLFLFRVGVAQTRTLMEFSQYLARLDTLVYSPSKNSFLPFSSRRFPGSNMFLATHE